MPSTADPTSVRPRPASPVLTWTRWPLRDETVSSLTVGVCICFAGWVAGTTVSSWPLGLTVLILLLIASWHYWIPVQYELGPKGITRSWLGGPLPGYRRRIAWSEFQSYEVHPHGCFLKHLVQDRPFAAVRGLFLPATPPLTELQAVLDYYLRGPGTEAPGSTQTVVP